MPTMIDVARRAGVSTSTVSHVVNGTRNVESATRKRVLDAIAELGYRHDTLARAMRRSRTDSIGLVVSDAGEPAFAEMVHGVEHAAARRGLTLLLANSAENAEREERAVRSLLERRVDGLILAPAAGSDVPAIFAMHDEKTPLVLLDRLYPGMPVDQVGADNRHTMSVLTGELIARGHRAFILIAGDTGVPTLQERLDGFWDAARQAHLSPAEQEIVTGVDLPVLSAAVDAAVARRQHTAVLALSTPLAAAGLQAMRSQGLATPDDLAFAAFDGFNYADLFEPQLTTVRQPAFDMGVAAVGLLTDRTATPGGSPRTVRLSQRIERRASTDRPPARTDQAALDTSRSSS